ncbi:MAG: hypothetical protein ACRCXZ_06575 [Patescibacteria group bacterium]
MTHPQKTFFGSMMMKFLSFAGQNIPSSILIQAQLEIKRNLFAKLKEDLKLSHPLNIYDFEKIVLTLCLIESDVQSKLPKSLWIVLTKYDIESEVKYHLQATDKEAEEIGDLYEEWSYKVKAILENVYYDDPKFFELCKEQLPGYIS